MKSKFYCSVNTLLGRIGSSASENVLLKLLDSQALPVLLYGTCAATLSASDLKSLSYAYDSAFAKNFKTMCTSTIRFCQYYSGYLSFSLCYDLNRFKFLHNLMSTGKLSINCKVDDEDVREYNR